MGLLKDFKRSLLDRYLYKIFEMVIELVFKTNIFFLE